jgi:caa(3)-type oxidase subunit IV
MDESHHDTIAVDPHGAPDDHAAHNVAKHVRKYLLIGLVLVTFTAITVWLSYVDFGTQKMNITVAMIVATFKAGLVAAIFMHLSNEKQLIYRILIFTAFFVLGLFFLTYLAWYDPVTR